MGLSSNGATCGILPGSFTYGTVLPATSWAQWIQYQTGNLSTAVAARQLILDPFWNPGYNLYGVRAKDSWLPLFSSMAAHSHPAALPSAMPTLSAKPAGPWLTLQPNSDNHLPDPTMLEIAFPMRQRMRQPHLRPGPIYIQTQTCIGCNLF